MNFRWSQELIDRVDAERGLIPRSAWVRAVIEAALAQHADGRRTGHVQPDPPAV